MERHKLGFHDKNFSCYRYLIIDLHHQKT